MKKIKLLAMGLISAFCICTMVNCSGSDSSKTTDNKTNTQTSQNSSSSSDSKTEDKNANSNKTEDKNANSSSKTEDKSSNSKKVEDKVVNTKYINIVNRTGVEICEMYVSATQKKNWGQDILTVGTMPADTQVNVMVTIDDQNRYFDLMVIDAYGTSITWEKIDLFSVSEITLYFDGTNVTANYK